MVPSAPCRQVSAAGGACRITNGCLMPTSSGSEAPEAPTSPLHPSEKHSAQNSGPYGSRFASALTRPTGTLRAPGGPLPWPAVWARLRATFGLTDPCVAIRPQDNILLGHETIMAYLGLRSRASLERYIDEFGLPVIRRPSDGRLMSSVTSIDQWIIAAAKISHANRHQENKTTYQRDASRDRAKRGGEPGAQAPIGSVDPRRPDPPSMGPPEPTVGGSPPSPSGLQRSGASLLPPSLRPKAIPGPPN
jgi:hypothetical protein